MIKKFSAKTQKLTPTLGDHSQVFSTAFLIEADNDEVFEKKGNIFVVADFIGTKEVDTLLIKKILNDVIHDTYYSSENVSPIQSLEKAVVEVRNRVTNIAGNADSTSDAGFNILTAVLWGNVFYLVQYGDGASFLMREGETKPINAASEGKFSVASGVIRNEDVIILCTKKFYEVFPPEKLLSQATSISVNDLDAGASGMLVRFDLDAAFTESEVVDIRPKDSVEVVMNKDASTEVTSISTDTKTKFKKIKGLKIKQNVTKTKNPMYILIGVLAFVFLLSVVATIQEKKTGKNFVSSLVSAVKPSGKSDEEKDPASPDGDTSNQGEVQNMATQNASEDTTKNDEQYLVTRVEPEIFYDVKVTEQTVDPSEIAVLDSTVVITEKTSGKMYVSNSTTPKFELLSTTFPGVNSLVYVGGDLSFNDSEGYKVFDVEAESVIDSYATTELGKTSTYLGYIYSLKDGKIMRYTATDDQLEGVLWGETADYNNAKFLAVAMSIYVVTEKDELVKYTSGEKDTYEISGLDGKFSNITDLVADYDLENVYIADAGNNRIVVLTKDGKLVKQFKSSKNELWTNIRGIGVSPLEDKLFVLDGSKVYEVPLDL